MAEAFLKELIQRLMQQNQQKQQKRVEPKPGRKKQYRKSLTPEYMHNRRRADPDEAFKLFGPDPAGRGVPADGQPIRLMLRPGSQPFIRHGVGEGSNIDMLRSARVDERISKALWARYPDLFGHDPAGLADRSIDRNRGLVDGSHTPAYGVSARDKTLYPKRDNRKKKKSAAGRTNIGRNIKPSKPFPRRYREEI